MMADHPECHYQEFLMSNFQLESPLKGNVSIDQLTPTSESSSHNILMWDFKSKAMENVLVCSYPTPSVGTLNLCS